MREHLYKAKRADRKGWVEGDLITNPETSIRDCILSLTGTPREFIEVLPETVCQYTVLDAEWLSSELIDPKIFNGDELYRTIGNSGLNFYVKFDSGCYYAESKDGKFSYNLFHFLKTFDYEKTGRNIHDKPETT